MLRDVNTGPNDWTGEPAESVAGLALQGVPPVTPEDFPESRIRQVLLENATVIVHPRRGSLLIRLRRDARSDVWDVVLACDALARICPAATIILDREGPDPRLANCDSDVQVPPFIEPLLNAAIWYMDRREPVLGTLFRSASWSYDPALGLTLFVTSSLAVLQKRGADERLADLLRRLSGRHIGVAIDEHAAREQIVTDFRRSMEAEAIEVGQQQVAVAAEPTVDAERSDMVRFGSAITEEPTAISFIQDEMRRTVIAGRVFGLEFRDLNSGRQLLQFHLTDETDSITCKLFLRGTKKEQDVTGLADGCHLRVRGAVQHDTYLKELVLLVSDMSSFYPVKRLDEEGVKRVELHAHTQMSALDGVVSATDLVRQAAEFGHGAVAITDHGVVQSYPEAAAAGKKYGVKILYGLEAFVVDTGQTIVYRPTDMVLDDTTTYVVFDTETTGLSAAEHELIEIAGVKMRGGEVISTFSQLIAPRQRISAKISEITNNTNEMVANQPTVEEVLPQFREFCTDCVLVAHNAEFDLSFLAVQAKRIKLASFDHSAIDTLALARVLFPGDRNHKLKTLSQKFSVTLVNHHRALADAEATGKVFYKLMETAKARTVVDTMRDLVRLGAASSDHTKGRSFHASVLVHSRAGLTNMYKLVSQAHINYFFREPRIPRSLLLAHREGLLIGSGCKYGEVFQAVLRGRPRSELIEMMRFYDYIELQPPDHYGPLIESEEISGYDQVKHYHRTLLELADEVGIPVVATGDVHFLRPQDGVFREIIQFSAGARGGQKTGSQPPLVFRATAEMLDAFRHLGERAFEVVVDNPNRIADRIEPLSPVPDRLYPPIMEGADDQVRSISYRHVHRLYGETIPSVVTERLEKELNSIITNGFSVNYLIAHKLVAKSLSDGYIVGSRGSVGSSLVATLMDITEVNPLPPHYLCPNCRHSEFVLDGSIGSGYDLPNKGCPECGTTLKKDGQDIPFETFLGFKGDKVPDIDLNFSGEYQARAHKYTEELFGSEFVYRAGTISTIAEKTAFGYVKKWAEERGKSLRNAEVARLVGGCTGIKRTTGQHPGGLIIVPSDHEIYDFCPIQHPADDKNSGTRTTHFDFHSIHDNLLKLDILGHDDPTVLRMLQDVTGIDARAVPVDDPQVYSLFCATDALRVSPQDIRSQTGTYGIPEFGTKFVRQMLEDTKPSTFADLVRISGLSHGTDVWLNNAQDLIKQGIATLGDVICCRDDIMVYLIYRGLDPSRAFKIMESVRKGKGLTEDDEGYMRSFAVKDWYMDSCRKIKYMFPKAHAAAYVLNAVRIAYFKVHHPLAFYAAYFTVRAEDFDLELMARGADAIAFRIEEIESKGTAAMPKEKALQTVLEVALEMTRRGFRFFGLDLYQSDATHFLLREDGLLPPFAAAPGVGASAAGNIVNARVETPFISVEDLQERGRVSKTVVELLARYGCLDGLPETNQLSLF